jgi:hypothetical protein
MVLECLPSHAILEITQAAHDKRFYKEIVTKKGDVIRLTMTIPKGRTTDEHYSQGVHVAKAVALGDEVTNIEVGDELLVDYSVDTETARILYNDGELKLVDVVAKNKYHMEDFMLPCHNSQPHDMYVWRKGDLDEITVIFGIVKSDGEIIPLDPFLLLEYVVVDGQFEENERGLLIPVHEGDVVMRRSLFAHKNSPIRQGDVVIVPYEALYEREVGDKIISVCIDKDVLAVMNFEK